MEGPKAAGSVFMCRLCNLFSPSRSQLLAHCTQLHPQQEYTDDIIIALQPLVAEPVEKLTESPVKRKRGRPKGSTKKTHTNLTESSVDAANSLDNNSEKEETMIKADQQCSSVNGDIGDGTSRLKCQDCHRSFRNRRQILKHICIKDEEETDEENGSSSVAAEKQHAENWSGEGPSPNQIKEKDVGNFKLSRTNQNRTSKEGGLAAGNKKSVVSVVLREDEPLPGVSKMVPVEESAVETESATVQAQAQSGVEGESPDVGSEPSPCEKNHHSDQEPCSDPTSATTTSKGFQEYSIMQDATNLLQNQLKIFACEFCNKIFKFRHSLVAHLRTHTQEKPFQCPHCDYASAIKANLNVHLRKHTGEKFSCQHCSFSCLSPGHLKVHTERVHLKVKQHCSFCDKKYSDVKNLLKHMENLHNLKDPAIYQNYQQLRLKTRQGLRQLLYRCPTCNRRFKNQLGCERHVLVHGPQRPFACLLCDHAATKMAALAAHVRKHLFLYVCCMCGEKFVSSQRLRSHLKESHLEFDEEQAFTNCINNSYYLVQPEGGMCGSEDAHENRMLQDGEGERVEEEGKEEWREGRRDQLREETEREGEKREEIQVVEGEMGHEGVSENGKVQQCLQQRRDEASAGEKSQGETLVLCVSETKRLEEGGNSSLPSEKKIHTDLMEQKGPEYMAAEDTQMPSSVGNMNGSDKDKETHSSSDRSVDNKQTSHSEKESEESHKSAFEQVFSSLQKSQLNLETFQRLRKIYGELECQYCGKLFWYKVHYNVHVRTHTKEHSHYCTKCSYSCITKSSLKRHQVQKHSGLLLPCSNPGCKYATPDKYKLQAHMRTHEEQGRSASCPVCQRSYPEYRLKHHIKTSHPDTLPGRSKGLMVQRAEKCPYCDSYFLKNSSDYQQHIWAHQGVKPYICSLCDYAGRSKSNLKTHMNRHNSERRHLCDLCGKKFKSKVTLKSHRLSHTNEGKRFQCTVCDFISVSKPSLLRHMEQHAEFKPFRCAHCQYSCNMTGALKRHYNLKHPDEKYENAGPGLPNPDVLKQQGGMKCPECEFVYGTKWELNRHLKTKHSLKMFEGSWEVKEGGEAQYVSVDEEQLAEAPLAALQDSVNIQQITEFSSETQDAVTSMVAMAPGTVTVIQQQLQVADEHEVSDCTSQLMVVNADGDLTGDQLMVVEEGRGLEALTVLTQGEDAHHYIVYVQEHTVEIN
ncbi:zinc finger protein ZFAT isoform 2-T2 [Pholidichthys leucotaenia]